jgi:hypothetical protein
MQTGFEVAKCVFEAESFNQIAGIARRIRTAPGDIPSSEHGTYPV